MPSPNTSQRASAASTSSEWFAHIRSLGLNSVAQYRQWCHDHGFKFHRKKTWRQEREERQVAADERQHAATLEHIVDLGLETEEAYLAWCRQHGFIASLEKSSRQRQKELRNAVPKCGPKFATPKQNRNSQGTVTIEHLRALELETVEAYRAWCHDHGFSDALNKKAETLNKEKALAVLSGAKEQRGQTRHFIQQIHAGAINLDQLETIVLRTIHAAFAALDPDGRNALLELLLHLESCTDLLQLGWGVTHWGRRPGNTLIQGIIALAHHHAHWLRPVHTWTANGRNPHAHFAALARHLLVRFEMPSFMDSVWFLGHTAQAERRQEWFRHIGLGQNIRTADVPVRLTKKMAHHFLQAPEHYTIEAALRWGQVSRTGRPPPIGRSNQRNPTGAPMRS
jgi:hypothetical protein